MARFSIDQSVPPSFTGHLSVVQMILLAAATSPWWHRTCDDPDGVVPEHGAAVFLSRYLSARTCHCSTPARVRTTSAFIAGT